MKRIFIFLCIAVLLCSFAFAETKTKTIEVKAQGQTKEEAIKNALYQAVSQTRGVDLSSGYFAYGYHSATADIDRKDTKKSVEFDDVSVQTAGSTLMTNVDGLVKTYEIINEEKLDDGTYEVTLKVWVWQYESPEKTQRAKLAIMPIRVLQPNYVFGDFIMSGSALSVKLSQKLSTALTESNKFDTLDREYIAEFARERNMLLSEDASLEEKAKLGSVLGADYMLAGTISDARIQKKSSYSNATGHTINEYEADFVFDYRLLVGPTKQIKLSDTVNISLETAEVKQLVKKWRPEDLDYKEMVDNLTLKVANKVAETIIDTVYPIRIASIDSTTGEIIINQGGQRIADGLVLDVYSQGKEIIDADTKESLGTTEVFIARIKIEKVTPRISYAKLVDSELSKLSNGMICRVATAEHKELPGRKTEDVQQTPTGGVTLPFDK